MTRHRPGDGHGLYRVDPIRAAEGRLLARTAPGEAMARAALAVADEAAHWLRDLPPDTVVGLLVGPGNNGGDALLAGLALAARGYRVEAFGVDAIRRRAPRSPDAARAWHAWQPRPIQPLAAVVAVATALSEKRDASETAPPEPAPLEPALPEPAPLEPAALEPAAVSARSVAETTRPRHWLWLDGLFGIGLARPLDGRFAPLFDALAAMRAAGCPIIAIDVPSGLDADSGGLPPGAAADAGPPGAATGALAPGTATGVGPLAADATVTMIADKPGLRTGIGPAVAGRITIADLGATPPAVPDGHLIDAAAAARWLPGRAIDSNKGRFGDLLVIGGRDGMRGAARLAARGALGAGVGKVSIATDAPRRPVSQGDGADAGRDADRENAAADPGRPEVMTWAWRPAGLDRFGAIVVGCGLGFAPTAGGWLEAALDRPCPVVVDADGLTWIARDPALRDRLKRRAPGTTVLTPHPLEAARLLGVDVATVQRDRIAAATTLARDTGAVVALKGSGTVVADPAGHWAINASGGPILATAGTGDVLAGVIGALAARLPAAEAACLGVWLHGEAGDLQTARTGASGTPAAVIAERLPEAVAGLEARKAAPGATGARSATST